MKVANGIEATPTRVLGASAEFIWELAQATGLKTIESQQQLLLLRLYVQGEMNQQDLPKITGVEKSSVARNIARLGEGERPMIKRGPGWVESFEDPNDRRNKRVRLTPRGKQLLDKVAKKVGHYFNPK